MQKALEFAIRSILAKRQTEKEMRERLQKRFPEVDPDPVIQRLKELDYLNDKAFAEAWIRHRSKSSPRGKYALNQEMWRKGVDQPVREASLEQVDEAELIQELAEKRWNKYKNEKSLHKRREKTMRYLLSRGFPIGLVLEQLNHLAESPEN